MPNIEYCLDLRELINFDALAQDQTEAIEAFLGMPALAGTRRLYIGSSFCPQAFLHARSLTVTALEICRKHGMKATLSLPIAAQGWLERQQEELQTLLALGQGIIDEVVANDHGMLGMLCNKVAALRLDGREDGSGLADDQLNSGYSDGQSVEATASFSVVIGRLFSKDTRDPRDPEFPWQPYVPNLLQQGYAGESYLDRMLSTWSYWDERCQEYWCPITGIELDPTHETLLLGNLPQQIMPVINGPLCYMSTGQICEYASVGLADAQIFRPNNPCAHQCTCNAIRYQGASDVEFAKLGRTVYFQPQWQCIPQGVKTYRQLVSPLWEAHC